MTMPQPTRLFHITAIDNLASMLAAGHLNCKNNCQQHQIGYSNIAHQSIQDRRATRPVPTPPNGVIHDYVPFYFAPRSPMLYTINAGNVVDCSYTQADILHFETTVNDVLALNHPIVFTDRNATMGYATFDNNPANLAQIVPWHIITATPQLDGFCQYWNNVADHPHWSERMEQRMAEFLVHQSVPLTVFNRIGVYNQAALNRVQTILQRAGSAIPVHIMLSWYF